MPEYEDYEKTVKPTSQLDAIPSTNWVSVLMSIAGWVILIVGCISGIYQSNELNGEVQFLTFLSYAFRELTTGLILIGIGEIIRLLHRIVLNR